MKLFRNVTNNHLLVLLLLCFSGNPLFVANGNYQQNYIICLIFFAVVCLVRNQYNVIAKSFLYLLPFVLAFVLHLILFKNEMSPFLFFSVSVLIGTLALSTVKTEFEKSYVDVMFWLAAFSLICFVFFKITGLVYGIRLSSTDGTSLIFYTQLLSFGEFYDRNSGMFWEPGAYQGYLNLALFFLLKSNHNNKKLKLLVLSLALLSTYSTTGYLVYAVIIASVVLSNKEMSIPTKVLFLATLISLFVYVYTTLDFLQDKIQYETSTQEKEKSRILDYTYFYNIIKENFIFGVGLVELSTGNGFVAFLLSWGLLGVLYYFLLLYSRIRKYWNSRDTFLFFVVVLLCLQGEGFLSYPLFLGLPLISLCKTNGGLSLNNHVIVF